MKKKQIRPKTKSAIKPKKQTSKKFVKKTIKRVVKKIAPKVAVRLKTISKPKLKSKSNTPPIPKEALIIGKQPTDIQLLEQFFDGSVKLKLWKVFSLNTHKQFTLKDLTRLTKTKSDLIIVALKDMMKQGVVHGEKKGIVNDKQEKEKVIVYSVAKDFPLLQEITQLILTAIPRSSERVLQELCNLQRLKTVLLSGFFTSKLGLSSSLFSATQSPIDMLLIFEKIPSNVSETMAELEHKLGRDLRYAALDQDDFKYRHSIGDKLIRDVLDFDHIVAMDKMAFFK